ncbi:ATP-binding protein [Streptomyces gamaensis]|uniref:ATP-binding protein n=1 Tax=Streptomyces gamaensis TaxID=1763542 RepID=A0ABW0YU04_9ACTN
MRVASGDVQAEDVERFRALTLYAESPDTVRAARDMAGSALRDWELHSLVDDVRVVVSELVSNAIVHATPDPHLARPGAARRVDVTLWKVPRWLFLGVADEDSHPPMLPASDPFAPQWLGHVPEAVLPDSGRGLAIVFKLADALWWTRTLSGGKTVRCRFDLEGRTPGEQP